MSKSIGNSRSKINLSIHGKAKENKRATVTMNTNKKILNWWAGSLVPTPFGTIFTDSFARGSIGSSYVVTGTAPTLDGTQLTYSAAAGANKLSNRTERDYYQCFENFSNSIVFTVGSVPSATESGPILGIKSSMLYPQNWDAFVSYHTTSGGSNDGKLTLYIGNGAATDADASWTLKGTSSALPVVNGRSYTLTLTRTPSTLGALYTATITDNVTTSSVSTSWSEDASASAAGGVSFANNTGRPMIASLGGTFSVSNWTFSSTDNKNIQALFVGDSITHGLGAAAMATRWPSLVGSTYTTYGVCAGPSNIIQDLLNQISNINSYNANTVYLMIGTNDIAKGTALATIESNYSSLVTQIKATGARVIHVYAIPRGGLTNINTFNAWLTSTYGATDTVIDDNTLFQDPASANNPNPFFIKADLVHPNDYGHELINELVTNTLFDPSMLTPVAWFRNGASYMASDGSQWTDVTNGLNVTAVGTARPTYNASSSLNGKPSYTFNGTTNVLSRARITQIQGLTALTMIGVGKFFSVSQDEGTASYPNRTNLLDWSAASIYGILDTGSSGNYFSGSAAVGYRWLALTFDGSQTGNANRAKMYVKNVASTLTFTGNVPAVTESSSSSTFKIGAMINTFMAGEQHEAILVNRVITANELKKLYIYFALYYNIG